jgi:hypothetical protein
LPRSAEFYAILSDVWNDPDAIISPADSGEALRPR